MVSEDGSTAVAEIEPPTVEAGAEPVATPEPVADPVATLREEKARLEGELAALRQHVATRPAEAAKPATPSFVTREQIQAALQAQQITEARAEALYGVVLAREERAAEAAAAKAQQITATAAQTVQAYLAKHPDLATSRLADVHAYMDDHGLDRASVRDQALALRALLGPVNGGGVVDRRPSVPSHGGRPAGSGIPTTGTGKPNLLRGIPVEFVESWRAQKANLDDPATAARYAERFWSTRSSRGLVRPA